MPIYFNLHHVVKAVLLQCGSQMLFDIVNHECTSLHTGVRTYRERIIFTKTMMFCIKDLMRSKNTSGYFSFYIDNISIKTYSTKSKLIAHINGLATKIQILDNLRQSP